LADFETMPIGTMKVVEEAARTFREYETQHRAKAARALAGTMMQEDRLDKAKRNGLMAEKLEKVLAEKRGSM
jgi:hypothetical protein